jgi:hypothetical protein
MRDFGKPPRSVELVIPDGFTGRILIRHDSVNGVPPVQVGGVTRYVIPRSGRLITTDDEPIGTWHTDVASYANGAEIPSAYDRTQEGILFFSLGTSDGVHLFFVGTRAELRELNRTGEARRVPDPW